MSLGRQLHKKKIKLPNILTFYIILITFITIQTKKLTKKINVVHFPYKKFKTYMYFILHQSL